MIRALHDSTGSIVFQLCTPTRVCSSLHAAGRCADPTPLCYLPAYTIRFRAKRHRHWQSMHATARQYKRQYCAPRYSATTGFRRPATEHPSPTTRGASRRGGSNVERVLTQRETRAQHGRVRRIVARECETLAARATEDSMLATALRSKCGLGLRDASSWLVDNDATF